MKNWITLSLVPLIASASFACAAGTRPSYYIRKGSEVVLKVANLSIDVLTNVKDLAEGAVLVGADAVELGEEIVIDTITSVKDALKGNDGKD